MGKPRLIKNKLAITRSVSFDDDTLKKMKFLSRVKKEKTRSALIRYLVDQEFDRERKNASA